VHIFMKENKTIIILKPRLYLYLNGLLTSNYQRKHAFLRTTYQWGHYDFFYNLNQKKDVYGNFVFHLIKDYHITIFKYLYIEI
jgi:hypothetical protein